MTDKQWSLGRPFKLIPQLIIKKGFIKKSFLLKIKMYQHGLLSEKFKNVMKYNRF